MTMSKMQWTELKDAPVNELFEGIRMQTLMEDETGIKAMLVEFDPGASWKGGEDVHESSSEEVYQLETTMLSEQFSTTLASDVQNIENSSFSGVSVEVSPYVPPRN